MYTPNATILKKYADVLIKFALNSGEGVKPGEVVQCLVPDLAKPLLLTLHRAILEAGAHPLMRMLPTGTDKEFYELANDDQLTFFPKKFLRERVNLIDHSVGILADDDLYALKNSDPKKIMRAAESKKKISTWMMDKELQGNFTWTIALYGTPAMAAEVKLSEKDYWQQIIRACFLDEADPVKHWRRVFKEQKRIRQRLNALRIEKVHIEADAIDLWIKIGKDRQWMGGGGRNIPSFEIFTSPDWRGTEGYIQFDQPLFRYGNVLQGIRLEFKKGRVIKATARKGEKILQEIIARPNADKLGEFSLTDARMTRIDKFMANTLFDENMGDKQGNTHIAVGLSYKDTFRGNQKQVTKSEWRKMGFNDSGEHTDIISTAERKVTAILPDGSRKIIYQSGKFTV